MAHQYIHTIKDDASYVNLKVILFLVVLVLNNVCQTLANIVRFVFPSQTLSIDWWNVPICSYDKKVNGLLDSTFDQFISKWHKLNVVSIIWLQTSWCSEIVS